MKVAVIANGNKSESFDYTIYDHIICADGAADWAIENKIFVDTVVGDLDSVNEYYLGKIPNVIKANREKDETDSELALDYAFSLGADEVDFYGALGGRLDHLLANAGLLLRYAKDNKRVRLIDEYSSAFAAQGRINMQGNIGQLISLIPINGEVFIYNTDGLKYPVLNKSLNIDKPYFISNEFTNEYISFSTKGWVLVITS